MAFPRGLRGLTPSRKLMLQAIIAYVETHGFPPSLRDLGELTGSCTQNAMRAVYELEELGYIERMPFGSRAMRVIKDCEGRRVKLVYVNE